MLCFTHTDRQDVIHRTMCTIHPVSTFPYTKTVVPSNRFEAWKACLGVLGIPFFDVVRVLAAVLILGNVTFIEGQGLEVDIQGGSHELKVHIPSLMC